MKGKCVTDHLVFCVDDFFHHKGEQVSSLPLEGSIFRIHPRQDQLILCICEFSLNVHIYYITHTPHV